MTAAFSSGVPPPGPCADSGRRALDADVLRGEHVASLISSPLTSTTCVGRARRDLVEPVLAGDDAARGRRRAAPARPAIVSRKRASETPISWRRAPAGFVSGPSRLKIVRTASSRRTGTTKRVAWWWAGANMKPKPASSMQPATAVRAEVDARAQRLEQVGRARAAGGRAVAVLGHRTAGAGGDQRGGGGDVERARAAAGAGRVQQVRRGRSARARRARASCARARPAPRPSRPSCAARSGTPRSASRRPRRA